MPSLITSSQPENGPCPSTRSQRVGRSVVQVDRVAGRSRVVRMVSQDPLKLISTRSADADCSSVVVSNYGGGFLQGDHAHLAVTCSEGGRLYLGTQALNKVYRCPGGIAQQTVEGSVGPGAVVASLPDPVMLYSESRFEQKQVWHVADGGVLALCDGIVSGRRESGEAFAFDSYGSSTRIYRDGRPAAIERMRCEPMALDPSRASVFGSSHLSYTLLVVGTPGDQAFESMTRTLDEAVGCVHTGGVRVVYSKPKPDVVVVRMIAESLSAADGPMRHVNGSVAQCLLKFNPIYRKA